MTCMRCGTEMTTAQENFLYEASGLSGVTLIGVEVSRCAKCGEYEVTIPRLEELHRVIAHALARQQGRLAGSEVRYLRKWLGWSGVDFAAHMGVSPATASRWETGAKDMGSVAQRLLRLMVLTREPVTDYTLDVLKHVEQAAAIPLHLGVRSDNQGWHTEAA